MLCCCKIEYDKALLQKAFSLCPKWRRDKAENITHDKVFAASVTAGLLLRYCLKERAEEAKTLPNGKPYIESGECFSLSHSGQYAVCAVSQKEIGVDIQQITAVSEKAVNRFCAESELAWLAKSDDRPCDIIRLWALKESYLKASGKSTSEVFDTEFLIENGKVNGPEGYGFTLSEEISGYIIAVCEKI